MRTITVKKDQSLLDIALQEYGSVEMVFQLVQDNQLNGITDYLQAGETLLINDDLVNRNITDYLAPYLIATLDENSKTEGIGFWEINNTFIVNGQNT